MPKPVHFWDDRFDTSEFVYGTKPNGFVRVAANTWPSDTQDVLALGAGEGRNAVFLAQQGHSVTALDYATQGLRKTQRLADEAGISVDTIQADVRDWSPERTWDAVVVTFLHLPPAQRPPLYDLIRACLVRGGASWQNGFAPSNGQRATAAADRPTPP